MSEIKRYNFTVEDDTQSPFWPMAVPHESVVGDYMLVSDHEADKQAALTEKDIELERARIRERDALELLNRSATDQNTNRTNLVARASHVGLLLAEKDRQIDALLGEVELLIRVAEGTETSDTPHAVQIASAIKKQLAAKDRLIAGLTKECHEVEQVLGKALGYPWYSNDQKNFPGATEADGVCLGEHVARTIAAEAASKLAVLAADRDRLAQINDELNQDVAKAQKDAAQWKELRLILEGDHATTLRGIEAANALVRKLEAEGDRLRERVDRQAEEIRSLRSHHHDAEQAFDLYAKTQTENEQLRARVKLLEDTGRELDSCLSQYRAGGMLQEGVQVAEKAWRDALAPQPPAAPARTQYMTICWDCGAKGIAGHGALETCFQCGGHNVTVKGPISDEKVRELLGTQPPAAPTEGEAKV